MSKILKIDDVNVYGRYVDVAELHPLVTVIDYTEVSPIRHSLNRYGVYGLFLRDDASVDLSYGCGRYDYGQGSLICVAPGQIGGKEDNGERVSITGWALLFHPDLLRGTPLERAVKNCSFFDYRVNEALLLTDDEHEIFVSLMRQIRDELRKPHDRMTDGILVGYIGLVLRFCQRFYDRQFVARQQENADILMRFEALLNDYYEQHLQLTQGLPSVQYCADRLCLSANYFGDLIRRTTGDTASNYIRQHVIRRAQNELAAGVSVGEVADKLGFEYPQHLSRMFKRQTGMTPSEYRARQVRR